MDPNNQFYKKICAAQDMPVDEDGDADGGDSARRKPEHISLSTFNELMRYMQEHQAKRARTEGLSL
eukprot:9471604-Pyramimonas_sp.AAC.1